MAEVFGSRVVAPFKGGNYFDMTVKLEPSPRVLLSSIVPPILTVRSFAMASPRPTPPWLDSKEHLFQVSPTLADVNCYMSFVGKFYGALPLYQLKTGKNVNGA